MSLKSWKPGTSRWAYLLTGIYAVFLAGGLPLTIAVGQEWGWVLFSLVMASGFCNMIAAYSLRRHVRRREASTKVAALPEVATGVR
jgi:hypothetical protein